MLTHTFQHIVGIGPRTEQLLWAYGIQDWRRFLACTNDSRIVSQEERQLGYREAQDITKRSPGIRRDVKESLRHLQAGDAAYFHRLLPSRERWRLYREFRAQTVYLDIETTGIAADGSDITLVGLFDGRSYRGFIKGRDMHLLPVALARYKLIVTYNGASFDLPFIQSRLGPVFKNHAHIDLRYPIARLGYEGGLKGIESQLSIQRSPGISVLNGQDAVTLWYEHMRGNKGALPTLIRYNAEDVLSLPDLADLVYNTLSRDLPIGVGPLQPISRPPLNLPYDVELCKWVKAGRWPQE